MVGYDEPGIGYDEPDVYYDVAPAIPPPPFVPDGWTVSTEGALVPQGTFFLLVDLATQEPIDEIPFSTHTFSRGVSIPGGWSATIRHDHPKATYNNLEPNRVACYVVAEDEILFGGIVRQPSVSLDEDLAGESLTVGGDGIVGYFRGDGSETGRFLDVSHTYTTEAAIDIVEDLVLWAQTVGGGDIGLEVVKVGSGPDITITFKGYELNNIGALVERLCDENDIEWDTEYVWDRVAVPPRPVARLVLTQGGRGVRKELDLVLGKNIRMLQYTADGFRQANRLLGVGAGDGKNMLRTTVADPSLISPAGAYPLLERVASDKTIKRRTRLEQFAAHKLQRSKRPARTATVNLVNEGPGSEEVPFGSFTTGDQVRLFAEDGYIHETGEWWRILGYEVGHDSDGARTVSLDMASAAEFED